MCCRCREKLAATETKLKAAVQDKTNVGIEKATLERELKGLRGQAGRLTKVPWLPIALPKLAMDPRCSIWRK